MCEINKKKRNEIKNEKWVVKEYVDTPISEVYETFWGDLYFFAETEEGEMVYVRLYNMPQFAERGCDNKKYILEKYGNRIWQVKKENWSNINTFEKNLLNKVEI